MRKCFNILVISKIRAQFLVIINRFTKKNKVGTYNVFVKLLAFTTANSAVRRPVGNGILNQIHLALGLPFTLRRDVSCRRHQQRGKNTMLFKSSFKLQSGRCGSLVTIHCEEG